MSSAQMQKLVSSTAIKVDGNIFIEMFQYKPHHLSRCSPTYIRSVELCDGSQWGKAGSVTLWNFLFEGKKGSSKSIVEAIDKEKKSIRYKVVEGDQLAAYKTFVYDISVDNNLVTWTIEYEKLNENIPDPNSMMEHCIAMTKDFDQFYNLNK